MSSVNQTSPGVSSVSLGGAANVSITNKPITIAGSEESHVLQSSLKRLIVRSRTLATLQLAFVSTESATKFLTIPRGGTLDLDGLDFSSKTLYLQSDTSSITVEIVELY